METKCKGWGNPRSRKSLFLSFFILFAVVACGGGGGGEEINALGGGFGLGEVRELAFNGNNQADVSFSDLSGSENFAFIIFAANAESTLFNIQLKGLSDVPADAQQKFMEAASEPPEDDSGDLTPKFHEQLRKFEANFSASKAFVPTVDTTDFQPSAAYSGDTSCAGGQGVLLKVLNSLSSTTSFDTTCAIPVRQTGNVIYYVDQEALNVLPTSVLNPVIDSFDPQKIEEERNLLGNESDINQDGKFAVYFTPGVNRLGASQGGFITGFFFGMDLTDAPSSNHREIFYVCTPDPNGGWGVQLTQQFWASNIGPTVLPHEFQHMISFYQRIMVLKTDGEESWLNEAISHFMEDLDVSKHFHNIGAENPSRFLQFLNNPNISIIGGTSLAQRGGGYGLVRHMYEQADLGHVPGISNGDALLRSLVQNDVNGVENIQDVTGLSFKEVLVKYYATLQLSNRGITDDSHYNFQDFNIMTSYDDNRGTVLKGVNAQSLQSIPANGSITAPGSLFYNADGSIIQNAGSNLSFIAAQGMVPGGAVIRLQ